MLWNPHIHSIVTAGAFDYGGTFHSTSDVPTEPFLKVWEHHVFQMLIEKGRIKPKLVRNLQNWKYSGFSVHKDVKIEAGDEEGLKRLTHYIARCPVAEAKIHRDSPEDDVLYDAEHSNPLPFQQWRALPTELTITRKFEVSDPLDFLAHRSCHIHVARGMTSIRSASGHATHPRQRPTPDPILRLVF